MDACGFEVGSLECAAEPLVARRDRPCLRVLSHRRAAANSALSSGSGQQGRSGADDQTQSEPPTLAPHHVWRMGDHSIVGYPRGLA